MTVSPLPDAPLPDGPSVSVVMIFKDALPFLPEAAASVLAQTWPAVELLLVDDGGSDGGAQVAQRLADAHPGRVRLLAHPGRANLGTGPSRRLGVREAGGDLVAFLDADDVWEPDHLAHEVGLLLRHPQAAMVCGRARVWRSWAEPGAPDTRSPLPAAPGRVVPAPRLLATVLRHGGLAVDTCNLLARRAELVACADEAARFRSTYEDQALNTLLQLRHPAVISGGRTAWYRQHPGSLTARSYASGSTVRSTGGTSPGRLEFLRWLAALPELSPHRADPALRRQLDALLQEQASSAASAHAHARHLARRTVPPRARQAAAAVLRRGRSLRTSRTAAASTWPGLSPVHDAYALRFARQWGEEVRGRAVEVGGSGWAAAAQVGVPVERVEDAGALEPGSVDCLLVPSALGASEDPRALLRLLRAALAPGGSLLALLPGLQRADPVREHPQQVWTARSAAVLLQECFDPDLVTVDQRGNARSAAASLTGGAMPPDSLVRDAALPVLVGVRALVPGED